MKIAPFLIFPFLFMAMRNNHTEKCQTPNNFTADSILQKMSYELNSLKNISYNYQLELNYTSENYQAKLAGNVYLDFQSKDTIIGLKYQIENEDSKDVFNGTEKFDLNKKDLIINVDNQPKKNAFVSMTFFTNSIITLKNALPAIIANNTIPKTLSDTTLNNTSYYVVGFSFYKKLFTSLGGFFSITLDRNIVYKILVDKRSYLPVQVIQTNSVNNDFVKTSFTNLNTNAQHPSELSWYYSTYTDKYKPAKQKEIPQLVSVGSIAPDWTLPLYNKNENLSLSKFKGKVILLDFWIKNCGPCIESVPHLNALERKFKDKKFEILSINSYDTKEDISWFCNKHKTTYKVLMNGKDIAEKYGVPGFPTAILIDKEGKVIYSSGGFNQSKIEELIEEAL